jgi:hypothetical protein
MRLTAEVLVRHRNLQTYSVPSPTQKAVSIASGVVAATAGAALLNHWLARKAERRNPPGGRFISVQGVRLHYVARCRTRAGSFARQWEHDCGLPIQRID